MVDADVEDFKSLVSVTKDNFGKFLGLSSGRNALFQDFLDSVAAIVIATDRTNNDDDDPNVVEKSLYWQLIRDKFPEWNWASRNGGFLSEEPTSQTIAERLDQLGVFLTSITNGSQKITTSHSNAWNPVTSTTESGRDCDDRKNECGLVDQDKNKKIEFAPIVLMKKHHTSMMLLPLSEKALAFISHKKRICPLPYEEIISFARHDPDLVDAVISLQDSASEPPGLFKISYIPAKVIPFYRIGISSVDNSSEIAELDSVAYAKRLMSKAQGISKKNIVQKNKIIVDAITVLEQGDIPLSLHSFGNW